MRLLLLVSLIVLVLSALYFGYSEINNRVAKSKSLERVDAIISEPVVGRYAIAQTPNPPALVPIAKEIEAKSEMTFTSSSTLADSDETEWFDDSEVDSACCDDEFSFNDFLSLHEGDSESIESKVESWRERFLKRHNSSWEAHEYLEFANKFKDKVPLSANEGLRLTEIISILYPTPENIAAYERMRKVFSESDFSESSAVFEKR